MTDLLSRTAIERAHRSRAATRVGVALKAAARYGVTRCIPGTLGHAAAAAVQAEKRRYRIICHMTPAADIKHGDVIEYDGTPKGRRAIADMQWTSEQLAAIPEAPAITFDRVVRPDDTVMYTGEGWRVWANDGSEFVIPRGAAFIYEVR